MNTTPKTEEKQDNWEQFELRPVPGTEFSEINGVMGFMVPGDVQFLMVKAATLPRGGTIVEIGSFMGLSSILMAQTLLRTGNHQARIYSVDTWEGSPEHQELDAIKDRKLFDIFKDNIQKAGISSFIHPIRKSSTIAFEDFEDGSIDLLFVDGDHSFEGCYSDLVYWFPKLRTGGVLIGHDCEPDSGVRSAVEKFSSETGIPYTIHPLPKTHYMFEFDRWDKQAKKPNLSVVKEEAHIEQYRDALPSIEDLHVFTHGHILIISSHPASFVDCLESRGIKATGIAWQELPDLLQSLGSLQQKGEHFHGIYMPGVFETIPQEEKVEIIRLATPLLHSECYLIIRTSNAEIEGNDVAVREIKNQAHILIQFGFEPCYYGKDLAHHEDMLVIGRKPGARPAAPQSHPTILWHGPQFACNSLSWVNRKYCQSLMRQMDVSLTVSLVQEIGLEGGTHPANFPDLFDRVSHKSGRDFDLTVTLFWPPDFNPPAQTGHWIHIQPWEFGSMVKDWFPHFRDRIDEIWVLSNHTREGYIRDGIHPDKVAVIPLATEPDIFNTLVAPSSLVEQWTDKNFRFIFCGGTIYRKGIDVLVKAYLQAFRRSDDVCLIIKDFGTDSFYKGQNFGDYIRNIQQDPKSPEIVYVTETFTPQELAAIYRACQALVHPYRGEGFGLPVAEAMACGLPAIVSKGGACDDFCPPDETFWVQTDEMPTVIQGIKTLNQAYIIEPSVESLIEQMRLAHADPAATQLRGARSTEHLNATLSWDKTARLMEERIRAVLQKPIARFKMKKARQIRKKKKRKRR